jgi:hypothetical protein
MQSFPCQPKKRHGITFQYVYRWFSENLFDRFYCHPLLDPVKIRFPYARLRLSPAATPAAPPSPGRAGAGLVHGETAEYPTAAD